MLLFCKNRVDFGWNPSYKNFITLVFVQSAIFVVVYGIMRVAMVADNIKSANLLSSDFASMFIMGARLDMRVVCIFAALVVLLGYATSFFSALAGHLNATRERERERVARRAQFMRISLYLSLNLRLF